jgi:acyl transferase domain-containing protein
VAGGLSLADASTLVVARSRAIAGLPTKGGMASLAETADRTAELIAAWPGRLDVAAINGPAATVVSGEPEALDELLARCAADGIRARRLELNNAAGHCVQMEAIEVELKEALAGLRPRAGTVPFWSTVTGAEFGTAGLDAGYWYRNVRQPVRFAAAVGDLATAGHGVFVEVSTHPILVSAIERTLEAGPGTGTWAITESLRRDEDGRRCLLTALGALFTRGVAVDWAAVVGDGPRADLPTYAFQRRRYWLENAWGAGGRSAPMARIDDEPPPEADLARFALLPPDERDHQLLTLVREVAAAVLGHESADVLPPTAAFSDAGFTSLSAIDLRNRLSRRTGLRLPSTLVFDHPTPTALMHHLRDRLAGDGTEPLLDSLRLLEESAASIGPDRIAATGLVPRLRALAAVVEAARGDTTDVVATLESASADDVLAFIDAEFGEV